MAVGGKHSGLHPLTSVPGAASPGCEGYDGGVEPQVLPPPRKPGRWTWAVAGRLCSRTFVAFALLWVGALVGWPESQVYYAGPFATMGLDEHTHWRLDGLVLDRDAGLRVLWDALFPSERASSRIVFIGGAAYRDLPAWYAEPQAQEPPGLRW